MKYAVIKTGGKQYKVTEGLVLDVEKLKTQETSVAFDDVLLVSDGENLQIGAPTVANAEVRASITGEVKGEKIRVAKYKAKVRYRRVTGHRQKLTRVKIDSITIGAAPSGKREAKSEKPAPKTRVTRKNSATSA